MAPQVPASRGPAGPLGLPTGRGGRLLALALALAALGLLWAAAGAPLRGWYDDRAGRLAGRHALAARMEALAAGLPALRRAAAAAGTHPAPAALIEGSSDAIAGAALQERVQQMAGSLGATLSSTESLPAGPAGSVRRVGVRVSITAPFDVMVRLVAAIEQASPTMLIDDLQLHGSRIQLQASSPLEGALTVLAFRQGGGPAGAPADPAAPEGGAPDAGIPDAPDGGAP